MNKEEEFMSEEEETLEPFKESTKRFYFQRQSLTTSLVSGLSQKEMALLICSLVLFLPILLIIYFYFDFEEFPYVPVGTISTISLGLMVAIFAVVRKVFFDESAHWDSLGEQIDEDDSEPREE
jgi:hypothetical protein